MPERPFPPLDHAKVSHDGQHRDGEPMAQSSTTETTMSDSHTRENAMSERPFPRDLARIGLEGGNGDDGRDLSGE